MFVRALVILLLVLNLGVAAWWALHSPPPASQAAPPPFGVARLQLLSEAGSRPRVAAPAPAEPEPAAMPASAPSAALQCLSFGPFADDAAASAARTRLQPEAVRLVVRTQTTAATGRGWRVFVPPQASLADAQALAQKITEAGFNDLFVVREGSEANSIALGRYRSEETAQRRAQALVAAGFAARSEPLGEAKEARWVDVAAAAGFDAAAAQKASGAAQRRDIDCASVP